MRSRAPRFPSRSATSGRRFRPVPDGCSSARRWPASAAPTSRSCIATRSPTCSPPIRLPARSSPATRSSAWWNAPPPRAGPTREIASSSSRPCAARTRASPNAAAAAQATPTSARTRTAADRSAPDARSDRARRRAVAGARVSSSTRTCSSRPTASPTSEASSPSRRPRRSTPSCAGAAGATLRS